MTTTTNTDKARYTRIGLAVAAVMIALTGITLIVVGVVYHQPALTVVAASAMAAGGSSIAAAYAVFRASSR